MQADYIILEHPSDLGIEARGKSLAEAFQRVASGLMSIILDLPVVQPMVEKEITITATDVEQLLVKWLSEILYLYDGQRFACCKFIVDQLTSTILKARVSGEVFSGSKHKTKMDVKAVTYHQLIVRENQDGGLIRVFLDI